MSAIWNSYSKSLTARSPRTIRVAPAARTKSASSPSNDRTSTRGSAATCWISFTRCSRVDRRRRAARGVNEGDGRVAVAARVVAWDGLVRRVFDRKDAGEGGQAEQGDQPSGLLTGVGGIGERHVVLARMQTLGEAERVGAMNRGAVVHLERLHIGFERGEGKPVQLHEVGAHGPARQRFAHKRPR